MYQVLETQVLSLVVLVSIPEGLAPYEMGVRAHRYYVVLVMEAEFNKRYIGIIHHNHIQSDVECTN